MEFSFKELPKPPRFMANDSLASGGRVMMIGCWGKVGVNFLRVRFIGFARSNAQNRKTVIPHVFELQGLRVKTELDFVQGVAGEM